MSPARRRGRFPRPAIPLFRCPRQFFASTTQPGGVSRLRRGATPHPCPPTPRNAARGQRAARTQTGTLGQRPFAHGPTGRLPRPPENRTGHRNKLTMVSALFPRAWAAFFGPVVPNEQHRCISIVHLSNLLEAGSSPQPPGGVPQRGLRGPLRTVRRDRAGGRASSAESSHRTERGFCQFCQLPSRAYPAFSECTLAFARHSKRARIDRSYQAYTDRCAEINGNWGVPKRFVLALLSGSDSH